MRKSPDSLMAVRGRTFALPLSSYWVRQDVLGRCWIYNGIEWILIEGSSTFAYRTAPPEKDGPLFR